MKFFLIFLLDMFCFGLIGEKDMDYRWKDHKKLHVRKIKKKKLKKRKKKLNKSIEQRMNAWKMRCKWERNKKLKDENLIYFLVKSIFLVA